MQPDNFPSVLIVGSDAPGALENIYLRALRRIGVQVVDLFNVGRHKHDLSRRHSIGRALNRLTRSWSNHSARRALYRYLARRSYDVVIVFKGMEFSSRALESYRRLCAGAAWVNINPDDPFNIGSRGSTNADVLESLSFFDLYCTWSRSLAERLENAGCRRVMYLPFGYDQDNHRPPSSVIDIVPDLVTFVGACDKQRERQLMPLADFNLKIYGEAWSRVSHGSPLASKIVHRNLYGEELAQVMAESAVSLNLLRSQNDGSHNMRTFEIPAMGGLMLTTRSREQHELFPENEASLMFGDEDELKRKVQWAIQNPDMAADIRRHGCERARDHAYESRAEMLLDAVQRLDGKR